MLLTLLLAGGLSAMAGEVPLDRAIHRYEPPYRVPLHFAGSTALMMEMGWGEPFEELDFQEGVAGPLRTTRSLPQGYRLRAGGERHLVASVQYPDEPWREDFVVLDRRTLEEVGRFPAMEPEDGYPSHFLMDGEVVVLAAANAQFKQRWLVPATGQTGWFTLGGTESGPTEFRFLGFWAEGFVVIETDAATRRRWVRIVSRDGSPVRTAIPISSGNNGDVSAVAAGKLWISSGNRVEVVDLAGAGLVRSFPKAGVVALSADEVGCWVMFDNSDVIERWRIDGEGGLKTTFRGELEATATYGSILSAAGRACVHHGGFLEVFDPAYSRPALEVPQRVVVRERDGVAKVRIKLDRAAERDVGLRVRTRDGSATEGEDYVGIDRRIVIRAGSRKATLSIPILDDRRLEPNESILVEFDEPLGLTIPDGARSAVVIEGSGLQANPLTFLDEQQKPVSPGEVWPLGDRMVVSCYDMSSSTGGMWVGLFERSSGKLIQRLDIGVANREHGSKLWKWRRDGAILTVARTSDISLEIVEFNATSGARLRDREIGPKRDPSKFFVTGPGRVLIASEGGDAGRLSTFGIEPGEDRELNFTAGVDGVLDYFIIAAGEDHYAVELHLNLSSLAGSEGLLRCFSSKDDSLLWEYGPAGRPGFTEMSSGGGTLVGCSQAGDVTAFDMETGRTQWKMKRPDNVEFSRIVMTSGHFQTGRSIGGIAVSSEIWEVETGVMVEEHWFDARGTSDRPNIDPVRFTWTPGGETLQGMIHVQNEAWDRGGWTEGRICELTPVRTRPSLVLLNQELAANRSGGRLVFRASEDFEGNFAVRAGWGIAGAAGPGTPLEIDVTPRPIPNDGSPLEIPYSLDPAFEGPGWDGREFRLGFEIAGQGTAGFRSARLSGVDGEARLPKHRFVELVEGSDGMDLHGRFAVQDDRIVVRNRLFNFPLNSEFLVIDRGSGQILRTIRGPVPGEGHYFGGSFAVNGDRLAASYVNGNTDVSEVRVHDLANGGHLGSIGDTTGTVGFATSLEASGEYLAVGTPGHGTGFPAGSYVDVHRWSDLARVMRKSLAANSELGSSLAWNGKDLYAVAANANVTSGGVSYKGAGRIFGYRLPSGAAPQPAYPDPKNQGRQNGSLLSGQDHLISAEDNGTMRGYRRSNLTIGWTLKSRIPLNPLGYDAAEGVIAGHNGRELMIAREIVPEILSYTRFASHPHQAEPFAGRFAGGRFLFTQEGRLRSVGPEDLGDFRGYRAWKVPGGGAASVVGDLDGNGVEDFEEYVSIRIDAGDPPVTLRKVAAAGWSLREGPPPPADVMVVVEARSSGGDWRLLAYRSGRAPWRHADGSKWSCQVTVAAEAGEARVRYLPGVNLGVSETTTDWPMNPFGEVDEDDPWVDGGEPGGRGFTAWERLQMWDWDEADALGNVKFSSGVEGAGLLYWRPRASGAVVAEISHDLETWRAPEADDDLMMDVTPVNDQWEEVRLRRSAGGGKPLFLRFRTTG